MFFRRSGMTISKVTHVGTSAPSDPFEGMLWLDTSQNTIRLKVFRDNQWVLPQFHIHGHSPYDITPQGNGSGLNADKLGELHASTTPNPYTIPASNSMGVLYSAWFSNTIRSFENTIDPVAYYNQNGQDYPLQVGEVARISFNNTTSAPLRIATYSDTEYLMWIIPSNTGSNSGGGDNPIYLNPNNTTYNNAFVYAGVYRNSSGLGSSYVTYSSFRIGWSWSHIFCIIRNLTVYKNITGICDTYRGSTDWPALIIFSTDWRDTTTSWTSLGTVVFPQNSSGYVLVQRIF